MDGDYAWRDMDRREGDDWKGGMHGAWRVPELIGDEKGDGDVISGEGVGGRRRLR